MLKLFSGLLAGIMSLGGLLRGRKRSRGGRGVFRHAVVVDRMSSAEEREGMRRYGKDGCGRVILDRGASTKFFVTTGNPFGNEDAAGFASLAAATATNARITAGDSLGRGILSDAYAEINRHGHRVARVFMNPREYSDVHGLGLPVLDSEEGVVAAMLWGAEVIVSSSVPEGTVYVCADREYVGVMPEGPGGSVGIGIHNPWGVVSITVRRSADAELRSRGSRPNPRRQKQACQRP